MMNNFLNDDFLLNGECAKKLYHGYAKNMPIVDYHCHVSPQEIFDNKRFDNIAQVWLGGDHYKWRLMRSNGVDEYYITGDAPDREKFQKFAESLPRAIGNPMYHWCHLELKKYFGYTGALNGDTAEEVWRLSCEKLQNDDMRVRGIIEQSNVAFIGTTDDPTDTLEWHEKLKNDKSFKTTVAPSFRPDKALNIEKDGWREYIAKLAEVSNIEIDGIDSLKAALESRIDYFAAHGCKASDHGLDYMVYCEADKSQLDKTVKAALSGEQVGLQDAQAVKTELLLFCAKQYSRLNWVWQIHYNCMRNPNTAMFEKLGPDSGFDCIGPNNGSISLKMLLDKLYYEESLPKTVLYSLDGGDNAFIDTLIGAYQGSEIAGKIQHGSAWWFNDNKQGMIDQMVSLANLGILGNFIGMLTDSRSFLSYTRHEYFRRILCELIGGWVDNGEYPDDYDTLGGIVKDICYNNAVRYFDLEDNK